MLQVFHKFIVPYSARFSLNLVLKFTQLIVASLVSTQINLMTVNNSINWDVSKKNEMIKKKKIPVSVLKMKRFCRKNCIRSGEYCPVFSYRAENWNYFKKKCKTNTNYKFRRKNLWKRRKTRINISISQQYK